MKKLLNTPLFVVLFITGTFVFSSCDSTDNPPVPDLSVVNEDAEVNMAFEDIDNITLTGLSARTNVDFPQGTLCDGAMVNIDEENKKITIDFGDGCIAANGETRKGIIYLTYTANLLFPGAKVITTFEDYEVAGKMVEGTRTITNKSVDLENNTINLEVSIQNGKVTWSDDTFVTVSSDQLRDIKLGTQGQYEVSITGTSTGTSRGGFDYTSTVSEPLIFTKTCLESGVNAPLSGIVDFQFRGIEASIDYGDGACDKLATIFYPNGSLPVTLD